MSKNKTYEMTSDKHDNSLIIQDFKLIEKLNIGETITIKAIDSMSELEYLSIPATNNGIVMDFCFR